MITQKASIVQAVGLMSRRAVIVQTAIVFPLLPATATTLKIPAKITSNQEKDVVSAHTTPSEWMDFAPHADINKFPCPMRDKW